jgi:hypothetical protein
LQAFSLVSLPPSRPVLPFLRPRRFDQPSPTSPFSRFPLDVFYKTAFASIPSDSRGALFSPNRRSWAFVSRLNS